MTGCSAFGCSNRADKGFCMKVFPKDPRRRALWALKVRRLNWVPTDHSFLCEVHFEADQWENRSDGKKKLKRDAVPTIFSFCPVPCKDKPPTVIKVSQDEIVNVAQEMTSEENCADQLEKNGSDGKRPQKCDAVPTVINYNPMPCKINPPVAISVSQNERLNITQVFTIKEKEVGAQFDADVTKLKLELMQARKTITQLWKNNIFLKSKLRVKTVQLSKYKKSRVKQYADIFNEDQLEAIQRKSMAFKKWSPKTIETALGLLLSCGVKGYENLLELKLPYPSIRTLQRRLRNSNSGADVNPVSAAASNE